MKIEQISYTMAYRVLPSYVFQKAERFKELAVEYGDRLGAYFYSIACQMEQAEPQKSAAEKFGVEFRRLGDDAGCVLFSYPEPEPADIENDSSVLAPYYAGVLQRKESNEQGFFVLGQNPEGGTTLRGIAEDGTNSNYGSSCELDKDQFVEHIKSIYWSGEKSNI